MSLRIARMRLRLPAGYAGRAEAIARSLAEAAARIPLAEARSLDALAPGPVRVSSGASDAEVASAAARQLAAHLGAKP